ncbi:MAG: heme-binding protein [Anaeromyxobacter sp.]
MRTCVELGEAEATAAIAAIRAELERRDKVAVIAVGDARGELIALLRMDGVIPVAIDVAQRKLLTAARERARTGDLGRRFQATGWHLDNSDPRFTGWDGGLPVVYQGEVVGVVAVSGLEQAEDAELAELGVAAALAVAGKG